MELVINISEEDFEIMKHNVAVDNPLCPLNQKDIVTIIANGIPLPKGHGNLIDINNIDVVELEDSIHFIQHKKGDEVDVYISAPIVIKADEEE